MAARLRWQWCSALAVPCFAACAARGLPVGGAGGATSVLNAVEFETVNCEMGLDGTVTMTGDDPNLILHGIELTSGTVCVSFAEPLEEGPLPKLYYSRDGTTFRRRTPVSALIHSGQQEIFFTLDEGTYRLLRLDINDDYQLQDIRIFPSRRPCWSGSGYARINWPQWLVTLAVFFG